MVIRSLVWFLDSDKAGNGGPADGASSDGVLFDWTFPPDRERSEADGVGWGVGWSLETICVATLLVERCTY